MNGKVNWPGLQPKLLNQYSVPAPETCPFGIAQSYCVICFMRNGDLILIKVKVLSAPKYEP